MSESSALLKLRLTPIVPRGNSWPSGEVAVQCDLGCIGGTHVTLALKLGWKGREGFLENTTKVETWVTILGRKKAFQVNSISRSAEMRPAQVVWEPILDVGLMRVGYDFGSRRNQCCFSSFWLKQLSKEYSYLCQDRED